MVTCFCFPELLFVDVFFLSFLGLWSESESNSDESDSDSDSESELESESDTDIDVDKDSESDSGAERFPMLSSESDNDVGLCFFDLCGIARVYREGPKYTVHKYF